MVPVNQTIVLTSGALTPAFSICAILGVCFRAYAQKISAAYELVMKHI